MKRPTGKQRKSAIRILEESVHLLRLSPAGLLSSYYIGSMPFVLGFLYFWGDMSNSAFAPEYCAVSALGLAFLFIWMKCWHAVFAAKMRAQILGARSGSWSLGRMVNLVATQTFIHSSSFLILPLALIMAIPFAWCFAFYQNATAQAFSPENDIKTICKKSLKLANLWPKQNHILLLVFLAFALILFINLAATIFILPYILKKFVGFETIFTLSGMNFFNSTFLVATIGITYLCMDPLVKAAYMLRCFYGESLTTGEDIRLELNKFTVPGKGLVAILTFIIFATYFNVAEARQVPPHYMDDPSASISLSPDELNRSIDEVMNKREFSWRMPHENLKEKEEDGSGPLSVVFKWVGDLLGKGFKAVKGLVKRIADWLAKLLPDRKPGTDPSTKDWIYSTRLFLIILLAVLGMILGYLFFRILKKHHSPVVESVIEPVAPTPDLEDEGIRADDLPANRWLNLAGEFAAKGSLRLAMRAFYLAALSYLADKEMITIEIYKSNLDYETELKRRAYEKKEILAAFSTLVSFFDRVWYGMYHITTSDLNSFAATLERIMALAEK
ncbi:MAG: hypothetical protein SWH54_10635 [Thermodesulfobacteriota bacterium]|nr:hypothetical protein [Thermodesulfobacteriota bacterium]